MPLEERELFATARRRAGLKQSDVARAVGISQSRVSDYERGARGLADSVLEALWSTVGGRERVAA